MLRRLADRLIDMADRRNRSPRHEARWLNLTGFCLRPGFGAPGDDWRVGELWKLWHRGPVAASQPQVAAEWWVLWRRIAGGLRLGQQQQIAGALTRDIVPRPGERLPPSRRTAQDQVEKWRCLGALERLPPESKTRIARTLLEAPGQPADHHYWVVARLGARKLFHGPADAVIPADTAAAMLRRLVTRCREEGPSRPALFAVASVARLCGIRNLDIGDDDRRAAMQLLQSAQAPAEWCSLLTSAAEAGAEVTSQIVGDSLPLGLAVERPDESMNGS